MSSLVDTVIGHSTNRVVFGTWGVAALCYFVPLLIVFRADLRAWKDALGKPLGTDPPEFDTKSASATGLTAVTAVLGSILGTKLLPTPSATAITNTTKHLPSAGVYAYLGVFFIAILGLALLFYYGLGRRLLVYLIADWFIFWGAVGAVLTFALALLEITDIPAWSRGLFAALVGFALLVVIISRVRSARMNLESVIHPTVTNKELLAPAPRWQVK